jgi:hypothetical protein
MEAGNQLTVSYSVFDICSKPNSCQDTIVFPPNYFFSPFMNEDSYLRVIGLYNRELYKYGNLLHKLTPTIFPKYEYKYGGVKNESLVI